MSARATITENGNSSDTWNFVRSCVQSCFKTYMLLGALGMVGHKHLFSLDGKFGERRKIIIPSRKVTCNNLYTYERYKISIAQILLCVILIAPNFCRLEIAQVTRFLSIVFAFTFGYVARSIVAKTPFLGAFWWVWLNVRTWWYDEHCGLNFKQLVTAMFLCLFRHYFYSVDQIKVCTLGIVLTLTINYLYIPDIKILYVTKTCCDRNPKWCHRINLAANFPLLKVH